MFYHKLLTIFVLAQDISASAEMKGLFYQRRGVELDTFNIISNSTGLKYYVQATLVNRVLNY